MKRAGIRNVNGVTFTETNKESMATALREIMRTIECSQCGWSGYIETPDGKWNTLCPNGCIAEQGNPKTTQSILHKPYDPELFTELSTLTYQLKKTVKIQYAHLKGTHDDRFWVLALINLKSDMKTPIVY